MLTELIKPVTTSNASLSIPSNFTRTYSGRCSEDNIRHILDDRVEELETEHVNGKTRINLLKAKISRTKKTFDGKIPVGSKILPQILKQKAKKNTNVVCFKCRKRGHLYVECTEEISKILCFLCGSTEHYLKDCKEPNDGDLPYATCFACRKTGHLSSACPNNSKLTKDDGNGCQFCGSLRHKKMFCPERKKKVDYSHKKHHLYT